MAIPFPFSASLAKAPAGRYNMTRKGSRKRDLSTRCVTLLPPSYGVARLSFCARKRERLLLHGMNSSEKRLAHPWNRNGPLTAKAPFLLPS